MRKHRGPRPHRTAKEWRRLVERWERSGLSAAAFAEKYDLSKRTLTWWRWRARNGSAAPTSSSTGPEVAFVPLVASSPETSEATPAEARWVLETGGVRVEMSGASALVVEALGLALERLQPRA